MRLESMFASSRILSVATRSALKGQTVVNGRRRVAVLISDMAKAGGLQRVAANLVRDLRPYYDTMLLSVEPLNAPVFH